MKFSLILALHLLLIISFTTPAHAMLSRLALFVRRTLPVTMPLVSNQRTSRALARARLSGFTRNPNQPSKAFSSLPSDHQLFFSEHMRDLPEYLLNRGVFPVPVGGAILPFVIGKTGRLSLKTVDPLYRLKPQDVKIFLSKATEANGGLKLSILKEPIFEQLDVFASQAQLRDPHAQAALESLIHALKKTTTAADHSTNAKIKSILRAAEDSLQSTAPSKKSKTSKQQTTRLAENASMSEKVDHVLARVKTPGGVINVDHVDDEFLKNLDEFITDITLDMQISIESPDSIEIALKKLRTSIEGIEKALGRQKGKSYQEYQKRIKKAYEATETPYQYVRRKG